MMRKGKRFVPGEVNEWMDCGNKEITVATNTKMLHHSRRRERASRFQRDP